MRYSLTAFAFALILPAVAPAHFLFVIPTGTEQPLAVAWSDGPLPDPKAGTESLTGAAAKTFDSQWAEATLEPAKAEGVWRSLPLSSKAKHATVKAEYGLVNRGEGQLFLIRYLAKWSATAEFAPAEPTLPLELTAIRGTGGLQFMATQGTKLLASTEVTIYEPVTAKLRTVKTDAQGLTPSFTPAGKYAARVAWKDATEGEYEGRKYRGTYYYSTLTVEYRP